MAEAQEQAEHVPSAFKAGYVCVHCEEYCLLEYLDVHHCIANFERIEVNGDYFYGAGAEAAALQIEDKENEEPLQSQSTSSKGCKRKATLLKTKMTDAEVEMLLSAVENRPALWNCVLPLTERSRHALKVQWKEVATEVNASGKYSVDDLKKKFKNLRDTFRRVVTDENLPSGSAASRKEKWKYAEQMEFLRDSFLSNETESNVTYDDGSEEVQSKSSSESEIGRKRRNSSKCEGQGEIEILHRIAESLCKEPVTKSPDLVDSMLHAAGIQIKKLPEKDQMPILMKIMYLVNDAQEQ